jgi:drug/metabolite transporter (DMT)-like permease
MTLRQVLLLSLALEGFPPTTTVFLRCAMAGVALFAAILYLGGETRAALSDLLRRPLPALLLAFTSITVPFVLIAYAQQRVPGGLTGVIVAATPIFVALFALRLDPGERFGPHRAIGLAVGLAGVALVVGVEAVQTLGQLISALMILVAAAFFALAGFVTKRYYAGVPAVTRAFFALLITAVVTTIPAATSVSPVWPRVRAPWRASCSWASAAPLACCTRTSP